LIEAQGYFVEVCLGVSGQVGFPGEVGAVTNHLKITIQWKEFTGIKKAFFSGWDTNMNTVWQSGALLDRRIG
jgi:hypothetical protein